MMRVTGIVSPVRCAGPSVRPWAKPLFGSPSGGGWAHRERVGSRKGHDPKGAPGTVARAILPQGSHAHREQRERINERVGDGFPLLGIP